MRCSKLCQMRWWAATFSKAGLCIAVASTLAHPETLQAQASAQPNTQQSNQSDTATIDTGKPAKKSTAEKTPKAKGDKSNEKTTGNTEVFIPSEAISEDFAVSFPVDI